jgi:hypothetical protein
MKINNEKRQIVADLVKRYGKTTLTRKEIVEFQGGEEKLSGIRWLLNCKAFRAERACYDLNKVLEHADAPKAPKTKTPAVETSTAVETTTPTPTV